MIYSFPFNEIVDCNDNYIMAKEKDYGTCFSFNLQLNGLFTNTLYACPKSKSNFQKILQFKYFTQILDKKCITKIQTLIQETFDAFRDPFDIFTQYEKYSTQVISQNFLAFIIEQIKLNKNADHKSASLKELKLIFLFRQFGNQMKDFIQKSAAYEKLEELKEKALEFIDASSLLIEEKKNENKNTDEEEELSMFFLKKLEEILNNKVNIQIFINNIEKVKSISYTNNCIKVFFRKK